MNKCTPFGSSISCCNLQKVSDATEGICQYKSGKKATNYLDDFLFGALKQLLCNALVDNFLNVCREVKFPIAMEKTEWASQIIIFLGMFLNTVTQTISIPVEKINKAINLLQQLEGSRTDTVLKLQQITGLLNYLCHGIISGRPFMRYFYHKIKSTM